MARFPSIDEQGQFEAPEVQNHIKELATGSTDGITVDTSVGTRVFVGNTMIHGDTGWRELPLPERFISGRILIKREMNDATLRFEEVEITGLDNNSTNQFLTDSGYIPAGFRPLIYGDRPSAVFVGNYTQYSAYLGVTQQTRLLYVSRLDQAIGVGNARASGELSWTATNPWPTSLPGTPA